MASETFVRYGSGLPNDGLEERLQALEIINERPAIFVWAIQLHRAVARHYRRSIRDSAVLLNLPAPAGAD